MDGNFSRIPRVSNDVCMTDFAPIFPGWNVWAVWQKKDLDFEVMMVGVSRDSRLKIWVEDQVRLNAAGTKVADSLDLKGSQVQILHGAPQGLTVATRKEQVQGPAMLLDGPAEQRFVRFFNRGTESRLVWPHDDNYLLDIVYRPSTTQPVTSGPGPTTISETASGSISDAAKPLKPVAWGLGGLAILAGGIWFAASVLPAMLAAKRLRRH